MKGSKTTWVVIILVILVLGWWFFLRSSSPLGEPTATPTPSLGQQEINILDQGTSDSVADIEKDLNSTDLNDLDKELADIEKVLNEPVQ
ncbi:MAG: hypothetical protein HYW77_03135 [Parcubacteria group bacterium]|nr:hypothetical protein [Parcubacteria group bacterium]